VTSLDSPFRSHSSHRESLRQNLLRAVHQRDGDAVARLSLRWVHRQGVGALDLLIGSLADEQVSHWWRQQLLADRRTGTVEAAMVVPEQEDVQTRDLPAPATVALEGTASEQLEFEVSAQIDLTQLPRDEFTSFEQAPPLTTTSEAAGTTSALGDIAGESANESLPLRQLLASFNSSISSNFTAPQQPPMAVESIATEAVAEMPPAIASVNGEKGQVEVATEAAPVRSRRLSRLRHLVRNCFEEVADTFKAVIDEDALPSPEDSPFAAAAPATPEPVPDTVAAPRFPLTPRPIPKSGWPPPAPAAHPGLERLRSWLPDQDDEHERRAS
jgi:hypothetical protein